MAKVVDSCMLTMLARYSDAMVDTTKGDYVIMDHLNAAATLLIDFLHVHFGTARGAAKPLNLSTWSSWKDLLDAAAEPCIPRDVQDLLLIELRAVLAALLEKGHDHTTASIPKIVSIVSAKTTFDRMMQPKGTGTAHTRTACSSSVHAEGAFEEFFQHYAWDVPLGSAAKNAAWDMLCQRGHLIHKGVDMHKFSHTFMFRGYACLAAGLMRHFRPNLLETKLQPREVLECVPMTPTRAQELARHFLTDPDYFKAPKRYITDEAKESLDFLLRRAGWFTANMSMFSWDDYMSLQVHIPTLPEVMLHRHANGTELCPFLEAGRYDVSPVFVELLKDYSENVLFDTDVSSRLAAAVFAVKKLPPEVVFHNIITAMSQYVCTNDEWQAGLEHANGVLAVYMSDLLYGKAYKSVVAWLTPLLTCLQKFFGITKGAIVAAIVEPQIWSDFRIQHALDLMLLQKESAAVVFKALIVHNTRLTEVLLEKLRAHPAIFGACITDALNTLHNGLFRSQLVNILRIEGVRSIAEYCWNDIFPADLCCRLMFLYGCPLGLADLEKAELTLPPEKRIIPLMLAQNPKHAHVLVIDRLCDDADVVRASWVQLAGSGLQAGLVRTMPARLASYPDETGTTKLDLLVKALNPIQALEIVLALDWPDMEVQCQCAIRVVTHMTAVCASQPDVWKALVRRWDASTVAFWRVCDAIRCASGF